MTLLNCTVVREKIIELLQIEENLAKKDREREK